MLTPSVCPPWPSTECSRAVMEGLCRLDLNEGISMDFNDVWWNIQWGEGANLSAYLPRPPPQTLNTFQLEGASLLRKSSLVVWSKAVATTLLNGCPDNGVAILLTSNHENDNDTDRVLRSTYKHKHHLFPPISLQRRLTPWSQHSLSSGPLTYWKTQGRHDNGPQPRIKT